jgi:hypothetical protein
MIITHLTAEVSGETKGHPLCHWKECPFLLRTKNEFTLEDGLFLQKEITPPIKDRGLFNDDTIVYP